VGPTGAPVLLVGEMPGKEEDAAGEPFVGTSGRFLFEGRDYTGPTKFAGLTMMGLRREHVRIENVGEVRPPENTVHRLTPATVAKWQEDFWRRLENLSPTVVIPMGNLALNTLRRTPLPVTKKGTWKLKATPQGKIIDWRDKIHNWRGSIFWARTNSGTRVKVIPTFHPAFVLRAGDAFDVWQSDWLRILGDKNFPELRLDPRCHHMIDPTQKDAHHFEMLVHQTYQKDSRAAVLACDIETVAHGKVVDCIGFSLTPDFSMTFDLHADKGWWKTVGRLLAHPIAKGWHFGLYDLYVLWAKGKTVNNSRWDSHQMHHCLDPRDQHTLAYCASRDLRVKFWKTEAKEDGKPGKRTKDRPQFLTYNGKDVSRTRALIGNPDEQYWGQLRAQGLMPVYRDHYRRLSTACLHLTQVGFAVDNQARHAMELREKALVAQHRSDMMTMAGIDLVAEKGLSGPRVTSYFYDTLKCKPFYRRGTSNRTADELAIRRLMRKYKKAKPMGQLVLGYRGHAKILQELRETIVSKDGRMRSRYTPTAKTGRLRSSAISKVEGINAQNRDRHSDLRKMFIANPGHVLVEVDQSQGESRIVDGMTGDPELQRLARMLPTEMDQHILNASKIFEREYDELIAAYQAGDSEAMEQRQLGKRVRHAANYGMEGPRMAEITLVETEGAVVLDPDECTEWLARLHASTPGLGRYHAWVRQQMIELGYLESSWGRRYYFKGLRLSKEDYKEGYAELPQHEVGVITNRLGFVPLSEDITKGMFPGANIVQQGHDSLNVTSLPKHAYDIARYLSEGMGVERTYPGAGGPWSMAMPIGIKVGRNWLDMKEWKLLPSREEFENEC